MYRLPMMPSTPHTFTQSWMVAFAEAFIMIFTKNCKICLFGPQKCSVLFGWGWGQWLWWFFCLSFPVTTIACGYGGKLWTVVFLECLLAHAELESDPQISTVSPNDTLQFYLRKISSRIIRLVFFFKRHQIWEENTTFLRKAKSQFQYLIDISSMKTSN